MVTSKITRRRFLKATGVGAAAMLLSGTSGTAEDSRDRPNIVYILADDMGYGDLACQNPESKIPTPNLDKLATEGMRFTDAHSPSAVCSPTRYGILTGRYCWRSRLKRGVLRPWDRTLIEPGRLTVGALLKKHGYTTACIGKWHLGWDWRTKDGAVVQRGNGKNSWKEIDFTKPIEGGPTTKGFDYYFGTAVPNYPPYCFIENDKTLGIPSVPKPASMFGNPGPMLPGWKLVDILGALQKKAVEFIDRHAGKPFFLYMPLTAPHTPIAPAEEFVGKSKAGAYGDLVHQVDHVAGQVISALKRNGLEKNTLVIFTSDNGSPQRDGTNMSGPVGSVRRFGHDPSRPWRGIKADVWDGGHRVPFIAYWPGKIAANSVNDEPVCHTDLMATVAAIVNAKLPADAGEDSCNILPALFGKRYQGPLRAAIVHHSGNGLFAIRQGRWKLITGLGSGGWSKPNRPKPQPDGPQGQLYDLNTDPKETKNLWLQRPDIVNRLTALLNDYKTKGRSAPSPKPRVSAPSG